MPLDLSYSETFSFPLDPCTCFEVFHASTGNVVNLQIPAKIDPNEVCTKIGILFNLFYAKIFLESLLAAVFPTWQ